MAYEFATYEKKGRIAVVTINRPERMNALHPPANLELDQIWNDFEKDPEVWVGIVTGTGDKAFSAGNDLRYTAEHGRDMVRFGESGFGGLANRTSCWKPIIAAVNGYALGGGCELAMSCDIILAGDNAVFGQPEINLGIMPGAGGTQRLTRAVGKAKAMELCLTGRRMDAVEAERSGLVSRIVPVAELHDEAMKVADKIANLSQHAVMMIKEAINRGFATTLAEGTRFERGQFYSLFATEDQKEGMAAFIEKRPPVFKNK
jgi:enoyl-CoA hydratase